MLKLTTALTVSIALVACNKSTDPKGKEAIPEPKESTIANNSVAKPKEVWTGPFGTKKGVSEDELAERIKLAPGSSRYLFTSDTAPSPHEAFDQYGYFITPKAGLCRVTGIKSSITSSVYGEGVKSSFNEIKEVLVKKYGQPTFDSDYLKSGSIWKDPNDWMMGLLKRERLLEASWFSGEIPGRKNSAHLPPEIETIELKTVGTGTDKALLLLRYSYDNGDSCVAENKEKRDESL